MSIQLPGNKDVSVNLDKKQKKLKATYVTTLHVDIEKAPEQLERLKHELRQIDFHVAVLQQNKGALEKELKLFEEALTQYENEGR